ncbi:hypothetical protein KI387_023811 [Taxus chinensis]|uniref:t-SNARE coiled-coil homology domain-containing protein n=1 Tax=Taxus chinensis TaxID=29808 RepID=A0AA38L7T9_TAXCH|nr:hypothetical protein KI387_023811 [Taxus chinensis]
MAGARRNLTGRLLSNASAASFSSLDFDLNEDHANKTLQQCEETTATVENCKKLAEEMEEEAAKTLANLYEQGQLIRRTHNVAVDIDHHLTTGEKLLGSLGGIFSRSWRPRITRPINGPANIQYNSAEMRGNILEQRQELGLLKSSCNKGNTRIFSSNAETTEDLIQMEKEKQEDSLSDLSKLMHQLKDMAIDMGQEIRRQNKALDHTSDDISELGYRVRGANARSRRLLGK